MMKFSGNVGNEPMNKWLNFCGNLLHHLDTGIVFLLGINRLRCVTLQRRVCTSRHHHSNYDVITSPADDRQPRQTCLGRGMHCPSASSFIICYIMAVVWLNLFCLPVSRFAQDVMVQGTVSFHFLRLIFLMQ